MRRIVVYSLTYVVLHCHFSHIIVINLVLINEITMQRF